MLVHSLLADRIHSKIRSAGNTFQCPVDFKAVKIHKPKERTVRKVMRADCLPPPAPAIQFDRTSEEIQQPRRSKRKTRSRAGRVGSIAVAQKAPQQLYHFKNIQGQRLCSQGMSRVNRSGTFFVCANQQLLNDDGIDRATWANLHNLIISSPKIGKGVGHLGQLKGEHYLAVAGVYHQLVIKARTRNDARAYAVRHISEEDPNVFCYEFVTYDSAGHRSIARQ